MPLTYLLYRCPRCGHDPLEGSKDQASCPGCGTSFRRGGEGGLIQVRGMSGERWEVPARLLVAAMEARASDMATGADLSGPKRKAEVRMRRSGLESPVTWNGQLLGFAEAMGEPTRGTVILHEDALEILVEVDEGPLSEAGDGRERSRAPNSGAGKNPSGFTLPLTEIRAVQTSSSSVQFSPSSGGLVELRFPHDSPFRWESLLREALRKAYRREGRGEILEFQPRVVTR